MNTRDEFGDVSVTEALSVTGWPYTESRPELETVNKYITTSRKFSVGYSVAKVVGAPRLGPF